MNLIIVGRNSYIGGYFISYASARGARVISLSSVECNFLHKSEVIDFFRRLDGRNYAIVFFAVVNKSVANSYQAFLDNIQIVRNLIDGCRYASIESIVYFSSVDVYGKEPELPINEYTRIAPDTWYGLAKYGCEWMLSMSGEVGFPVTVLRIPGVYGHAPKDKSVIGQIIESIRKEKKAVVNGNGKVLRDYVWVDDLCRVIDLLLPVKYKGIINVATGRSEFLIDIIERIGQVLEEDFEIVYRSAESARDFDLVFDNGALMTLFPRFSFSDMTTGLRTYHRNRTFVDRTPVV
jgi:UDP-glucose 4-epimerase